MADLKTRIGKLRAALCAIDCEAARDALEADDAANDGPDPVLTDQQITAGLEAARMRAADFDYGDGSTAIQRASVLASTFRKAAGGVGAVREPQQEKDHG